MNLGMNFNFQHMHTLVVLAVVVVVASIGVQGLSFDLPASTPSYPDKRCFSLYIGKDVLVAGRYTVGEGANQRVAVQVVDTDGSQPHANPNAIGEQKFSFTTHAYSDYSICFTNTITNGASPHPSMYRTVSFSVNFGADARDTAAEVQKEHLKPIEIEMRVLEEEMEAIVDEQEYMKHREARMRDTNESTNDRVKWFGVLSMLTLISSGCWQVWYLRNYFKTKKLL